MLLGTSAKNSLGSSKKIEKKPKLPISNMKRKAALIEQVSKKSQQTNQSTIIIHQSKISPDVYIYIHLRIHFFFVHKGLDTLAPKGVVGQPGGWFTVAPRNYDALGIPVESPRCCLWSPHPAGIGRYFLFGGDTPDLICILCGIHLHIIYLCTKICVIKILHYHEQYIAIMITTITTIIMSSSSRHHHHLPSISNINPLPFQWCYPGTRSHCIVAPVPADS